MVNYQNPKNSSCFGAIAEDKTKLSVKIRKFPKPFSSPYVVGDHLQIFGKFQLESNILYIEFKL